MTETLSAAGPVFRHRYPDGELGWLVTGQEAGKAVLADARFSTRPLRMPMDDGGGQEALSGPESAGDLLRVEGSQHARHPPAPDRLLHGQARCGAAREDRGDRWTLPRRDRGACRAGGQRRDVRLPGAVDGDLRPARRCARRARPVRASRRCGDGDGRDDPGGDELGVETIWVADHLGSGHMGATKPWFEAWTWRPIPLTIAGRGKTVLGLAACHAARWNAIYYGVSRDEALRQGREDNARLDELCTEAGRQVSAPP